MSTPPWADKVNIDIVCLKPLPEPVSPCVWLLCLVIDGGKHTFSSEAEILTITLSSMGYRVTDNQDLDTILTHSECRSI